MLYSQSDDASYANILPTERNTERVDKSKIRNDSNPNSLSEAKANWDSNYTPPNHGAYQIEQVLQLWNNTLTLLPSTIHGICLTENEMKPSSTPWLCDETQLAKTKTKKGD